MKLKKNTNNLLIIGGTGFIGHHLALKAIKKSWNIVKLGDRIFRTETASIIAHTLLRDF